MTENKLSLDNRFSQVASQIFQQSSGRGLIMAVMLPLWAIKNIAPLFASPQELSQVLSEGASAPDIGRTFLNSIMTVFIAYYFEGEGSPVGRGIVMVAALFVTGGAIIMPEIMGVHHNRSAYNETLAYLTGIILIFVRYYFKEYGQESRTSGGLTSSPP